MVGKAMVIMVAGAMTLSACTSTKQVRDVAFTPPSGQYDLIVMRPQVSVGLLTAGGMVEAREDWTEQARTNLIAAIRAEEAGRGGRTTVAATYDDAGVDPQLAIDLQELHDAVRQAIITHKYAGVPLPTKRNTFDWTLGEQAVEFGRKTGHDYALFLYAEDSFSSSGATALKVLGLAGCIVGACVLPRNKTRLAFASLVDLKTGRIVWNNLLQSSLGDMRTPEGAASTVDTLLGSMKEGRAVARARREGAT